MFFNGNLHHVPNQIIILYTQKLCTTEQDTRCLRFLLKASKGNLHSFCLFFQCNSFVYKQHRSQFSTLRQFCLHGNYWVLSVVHKRQISHMVVSSSMLCTSRQMYVCSKTDVKRVFHMPTRCACKTLLTPWWKKKI